MSYESLVISPSEYKVVLTIGNLVWPLLTLEGIDMNASREFKEIFFIAQENAGLTKRKRVRYSGNLILQIGEIMSVMNAAGFVEGTQIVNSILGITSLTLNGLKRVYSGLNINTESISLKSTDKDSLVTLGWNAIKITGIAI
jgi:hypothetical protein